MSDNIDVHKIALLSRLSLKEDEEKVLKEKFSSIKEYIDLISEVKLDEDLPEKDESLQQVYHEDKMNKQTIPLDSFSKHTENSFFKVPKVIE